MKVPVIQLVLFVISFGLCASHVEFTASSCLSAHNKLRALHKDTNDVTYDVVLEKSAKEKAEFFSIQEDTSYQFPTRPLPKRRRKRRHDDDVRTDVHIESWDGDIFFFEGLKNGAHGQSVHKFCCKSEPHCPKEFFHGLHFPPSADGVVNDFYKQEINSYDFDSGKKKTQFYTQIRHFTNIVWKSTTKIGCAQFVNKLTKCAYTVIYYKEEGSTGGPDAFKKNVGPLKTTESDDSQVVTIFLIVFFIVLFIVLILLCYCCRDNLREKYLEVKIKTDTMKAEQELETNSTAFWWMRSVKKKSRTKNRPTHTRSTIKHQSLKEKPSIEVLPNSAPYRSVKMPPRVRGESNAQTFAIMYHGISKKAEHYEPNEQIYENTRKAMQYKDDPTIYENIKNQNKPLPKSPVENNQNGAHKNLARELSFSGKPTPPPVPKNPVPSSRQNPMMPKQPPPSIHGSVSFQKPKTTTRPSPPTKPLIPPPQYTPPVTIPRPVPAARSGNAPKTEESSPSVSELRNQFNNQRSSPTNSNLKTPPVKPKPLMPPGYRHK